MLKIINKYKKGNGPKTEPKGIPHLISSEGVVPLSNVHTVFKGLYSI